MDPSWRSSIESLIRETEENLHTTPANGSGGIGSGSIGAVLGQMGDYPGALEKHTAALAMNRQIHGGEDAVHPSIATALGNIGYVLAEMGDLPGALQKRKASLAMERQVRYLDRR